MIAGPCTVESEEQTIETAIAVKKAGAQALRGGAFKPRSSPYAFQGLGLKGLQILKKAKEETGLPIVTEVIDSRDVFWVPGTCRTFPSSRRWEDRRGRSS
jgi:3-deoxy-7-phosphoheptulonate synthase